MDVASWSLNYSLTSTAGVVSLTGESSESQPLLSDQASSTASWPLDATDPWFSGLPSPATSAFLSGIIREPLHGVEAICPIGDSFDDPALDELEAWVASPENVIENFVIASKVDTSNFKKHSRTVNLPGFTVTIKEELQALKDVCGQEWVVLCSTHTAWHSSVFTEPWILLNTRKTQ
jgi:hypothetical protein